MDRPDACRIFCVGANQSIPTNRLQTITNSKTTKGKELKSLLACNYISKYTA